MAPTPSLTSLAQRLLERAVEFDKSPPTDDGIQSQDLKVARTEVLEALHEIQMRVQGPVDLLEGHQIHNASLSCLKWLIHFNIFTQLPTDYSPISYTSLATLASVPLKSLHSVSRMAMLSGLFTEPDPTLIAHSPLSMSFATDSRLRDWGAFITQYNAPIAHAMTAATEKWGDTYSKSETAFNEFAGTTDPFFEYMKKVPGMADLFARYMESLGLSEGARLEHLLEGFDWASLNDQTHIVDVGGSKGFVSIALANIHPTLLFTVQDLASGIGSQATLSKLSPSVASRIRFAEHDFFDSQPPPPADWPPPDIYLLRRILHDWPLPQARRILSQLAIALRDGGRPAARIIIMDTILPAPGTIGRLQEAKLRMRDLTMAQIFNSNERGIAEWKELLETTVPKLKLSTWRQPSGSAMAVMEVTLYH